MPDTLKRTSIGNVKKTAITMDYHDENMARVDDDAIYRKTENTQSGCRHAQFLISCEPNTITISTSKLKSIATTNRKAIMTATILSQV